MHRNVRWVAAGLWTVALTIATLPLPAPAPSPDNLDASWALALVLAARDGIHAGQILWTYGPLGRLEVLTPWFRVQWTQAVLTVVAVDALFIALLAVLLVRSRASVIAWILATAVVLAPSTVMPVVFPNGVLSSVEYQLAFIAVICILMAMTVRSRGAAILLGMLAGTSFATLALVKQTGAPVAVVTLVLALVASLRAPRLRAPVVAAWLSAVVAAAALWFATGQSLSDAGQYIRGSLALSADYRAAMSIGGWDGIPLAGGLLLALVALLVYTAVQRAWTVSLTALLLLPLCVGSFEEAFARNDSAHAPIFAGFLAVAAVLIVIVCPQLRLRRGVRLPHIVMSAAAAVFAIVVIVVTYASGPNLAAPQTLRARLQAWPSALQLLTSDAANASREALMRSSLAQTYSDSAAEAALIGASTVDVYPWEVDLIWTYQLHWDPWPVLASYSAFDPYLDNLDAQHLLGPSRPAYVLYNAAQTIDGRYPAFDDPLFLQAVLREYTVDAQSSGAFLLLRARAVPLNPIRTQLGTVCTSQNGIIDVPARPGQLVFADVSLPYSPRGELLTTLLKDAYPTVSLQTAAGWSPTYRWVDAQGPSGLLVNAAVRNNAQMSALLQGRIQLPVTAVRIGSDSPPDYSNTVCASLWSEPAPPG